MKLQKVEKLFKRPDPGLSDVDGGFFNLSLHKQHISLYVKRLGQRFCVDWINHNNI